MDTRRESQGCPGNRYPPPGIPRSGLSRWKTQREEGLGGSAVTMEDREEGLGRLSRWKSERGRPGEAVTWKTQREEGLGRLSHGRQREEGLGRLSHGRQREEGLGRLSRWKTQRGKPGEAVTIEDTERGRPGEAVTMEDRERKGWGGCHDRRQGEEGLGRVEEVEGGKEPFASVIGDKLPGKLPPPDPSTPPTLHPGQ